MINNFSNELSKLILSKLGIYIASDKMGIYIESIYKKSARLEKFSEEKYLEYLTNNSTEENEEWKLLIDCLNISETYFLRDAGQFEILEKNILPSILEKNFSSKRIRIWSAGCSTGEEPYSIAILLSELISNISEWEISITATDINGDSIKKAILGEYSSWSFRGVPEGKIHNYFINKKNLCQIKDSIRKFVTFTQNNLFSTSYYNQFDLVLCRNVFIYFDDESKKKILNKFEISLTDNGYLLIGHSEAGHLMPDSFHPIQYQKSIVYRKKDLSKPTLKPNPEIIVSRKVPLMELSQVSSIKKRIDTKIISTPIEDIINAKQFANSGKIQEAEVLVAKVLAKEPFNDEALFLNAQLREANGKWEEAIEIYKKLIYLKPYFLESYLNLVNLYNLLHKNEESQKIRRAGLNCLQENENLKEIYKEKGYNFETLESFFSAESGIWL